MKWKYINQYTYIWGVPKNNQNFMLLVNNILNQSTESCCSVPTGLFYITFISNAYTQVRRFLSDWMKVWKYYVNGKILYEIVKKPNDLIMHNNIPRNIQKFIAIIRIYHIITEQCQRYIVLSMLNIIWCM